MLLFLGVRSILFFENLVNFFQVYIPLPGVMGWYIIRAAGTHITVRSYSYMIDKTPTDDPILVGGNQQGDDK